jgi:3-hydroxyisobutyrate dehydrogenase
MDNTVGIAGLGRMGDAMGRRLLAADRPIAVWNRTASKSIGLSALGACAAATPTALASRVATTISTVTDDAAANVLYLGENGLLAGDVGGKLFVEMSTLTPGAVRALAGRCLEKGARFVAAPVLGTTWHVERGELVVLASGSAADIDAAREVFEPLARKVLHLGDIGASSAMKLAVNLVLGIYLEGLSEAFTLASREGVTLDAILDVMAASPLANQLLTVKRPIFEGASLPVAFDIRSMRKDLESAIATASARGLSLPAASASSNLLAGGIAAGWGHRDIGELPKFFRENPPGA